MDLGDPVLEGCPFDFILDLAITQDAFKGDELPLLENLGELREIPPGINAMPFGARFVVAFVVLPVFLGGDIEEDVLTVVLSGFGFCVLSEAADEDDFVNMVFGSVSFGLSAVCSFGDWTESAEGDPDSLWAGVRTLQRRVADSGKESVRPKGGVF
jgi:hypothetical protein